MRKTVFSLFFLFLLQLGFAQKKPLDHSVYDTWQSIGERMISNDGRWIVYSVDVQEGDNELVIQSSDARYKKVVPRGYSAIITEDSRYAIFKIKPFYKETREARIKKKKTEDIPKDSLAIIELGKDSLWKLPRIKNYRTPQKSSGWLAYQVDKTPEPAAKGKAGTTDAKKLTDSLTRIIDSLEAYIKTQPGSKKNRNRDETELSGIELSPEMYTDAEGDDPASTPADAGTTLILRKLETGQEKTFMNVLEFYFSKNGRKLLIEAARNSKDSLSKPVVILYDLQRSSTDTLSRGGNDFKSFTISDDGAQVAYIAERDAKPKDLQKFYKLWYYKEGQDSALLLLDKNTVGMKLGSTISESGSLTFSKSGNRLFFGTAAIQPPKDTTLIDIDLVKLDIWHYNDDYLQTAQLNRLPRDLQENFLAVYQFDNKALRQLGSKEIPVVLQTNEGDGETFVGVSDFGKRIESQWTGNTKKDIYAINLSTGDKKLVKKDLQGVVINTMQSPTGKYIMWYDSKAKGYFVYDGDSVKNITAKIKTALWDEENDTPTEPSSYGIMGWHEGDSLVYIYDRYDIWCVDPENKKAPYTMPPFSGRKEQVSFRYVRTDPDEKAISRKSRLIFRVFNNKDKKSNLWMNNNYFDNAVTTFPLFKELSYGNVLAARQSPVYIFTKENYEQPSNLFVSNGLNNDVQLSNINLQQKNYNWGTAELYKWKALNGKAAEGILYKPEDFNPAKKYPLILYFYETLSNSLYDYIDPAPTPSRLNIPFYVSRGYLVFTPDIRYTTGHPAKSAYDYVVGATLDLSKNKWVDAKNIGIQGQSWGGIQVAQLITMTDIYKAAWAGAPVANMTSAYGGIRWEGGVNRQFQYEKTQSRIGATLWEKPELYIENSPLFHLPKVKTPLVIMSNDADGAVPWYQGIELFTGMRRLGKKVWMLNYNGEAHNLIDRKNRKDIQIREQQYFDWLLKGAKPARWITEGVPAVRKGKDWGLELVD